MKYHSAKTGRNSVRRWAMTHRGRRSLIPFSKRRNRFSFLDFWTVTQAEIKLAEYADGCEREIAALKALASWRNVYPEHVALFVPQNINITCKFG